MTTFLLLLPPDIMISVPGGGDSLKWLVDITIGYPERPLDMQTIIGSYRKPCNTILYYRKYDIRDVPADETEQLTQWLYDRFVEKEKMLDYFYANGTFPVVPEHDRGSKTYHSTPQLQEFSTLWFVSIQLFYFTITVLQYYSLYQLYLFVTAMFS